MLYVRMLGYRVGNPCGIKSSGEGPGPYAMAVRTICTVIQGEVARRGKDALSTYCAN